MIDATWRAYRPASASGAAHMKNASVGDQALAGRNYIAARYGSPVDAWAFWQAHRYYDQGGIWEPGPGWNGTGLDERVLSPRQDDYFKRFVDSTSGTTGGGTPTWHFYLGDREITDLVDARMEYRSEQESRDLRSAR